MTSSHLVPPRPGPGQTTSSQSPSSRRDGDEVRHPTNDLHPNPNRDEVNNRVKPPVVDPVYCLHCGSRYVEKKRCLDCGRRQ